MKIGVLALQGAFIEHVQTLRAIGVEPVEVRLPEDLEGLSGLIIPGGESTTMRKLIDRWGLRRPILDLAASGAPIFGTCAGMIVLARDIAGGEEPVLPLLDVRVERNAFGRQLDSFEAQLDVPILGDQPVHAVFIRAPIIERTNGAVDVLAQLEDGRIVAVRERNIIATSFHPELAGETRFHRLVATMASEHDQPGEGSGRRPHPTRRMAAADRPADPSGQAPGPTPGEVPGQTPDQLPGHTPADRSADGAPDR
ncbi:MAG TPA: pyridoxal 5'-phosphate synthase glutaminase subunit PdxT [Candidatus Limnocylindrales bacterium]